MSVQRTVRVWEALDSRRVVRVGFSFFELLLLLAGEALGLGGEGIVVVRVACVLLIFMSTIIV